MKRTTKPLEWIHSDNRPDDDNSDLSPINTLTIWTDSQSGIDLAENPKHHDRSKHIAIRRHYVRDAVANGHIKLEYPPSSEMIANALTKALPKDLHNKHTQSMG